MYDVRPETERFVDQAPVRIVNEATLDVPRAELFRTMADPTTWPRWFISMQSAEWTSARTECVDAERTVSLVGLGRFDERFIAWERDRRFAFTLLRSSSRLMRALVEDYRLDDAPGGGTRWTWVMALEPRGVMGVVTPVARMALRRVFARSARRLERYVRTRGVPT